MTTGKHAKEILSIASRREPFVDDYLVGKMHGVALKLQQPAPQNVVLDFDRPWEGNCCCYVALFKDGGLYRMYYRGASYFPGSKQSMRQVVCYAESYDGIKWHRPNLGLYAHAGSKRNNIVLTGPGSHNFSPFRDENPSCKPDARYKALAGHGAFGSKENGLFAFKSKDGFRWELMRAKPVITDGAFDSQNLAFWDAVRGCYIDFHRDFRPAHGTYAHHIVFKGRHGGRKFMAVRDIKTCRSSDFLHWSKPQWVDFGAAPLEQLYTNAVTPMPGCGHVLVGFPKRFVSFRKRIPEDHGGVSDAVFMSSRDGLRWQRWAEAFIRPGLLRDAWFNRNNMTAWGLAMTAPVRGDEPEISLYVTEGYYTPRCRLRRYTVRQDGFVSIHAGARNGEFTTRPLRFEGSKLFINFSTSAPGLVRAEIQDLSGKPVPGFSLRDCPEMYGDALNEPVAWKGGADLAFLAGKPVKLRFTMRDADLYAIQFK
ncbi:MAG: hypothetical protein WC299_11955 [Kiritimatiellia bacterium]